MRALLGIIAGLLVADALRNTVSFVMANPRVPQTWANFLVALAAMIFVTRVVIDNVLYYSDVDIDTIYSDYWTRVLLILLDLASYSFCYAIVARFTFSTPSNISRGAARWMLWYATAVEILHFFWCLIAVTCLHIKQAVDKETRRPWLRKWLALSATWSVFGLGASIWGYSLPNGSEPVTLAFGYTFFIVSAVAAFSYVAFMKNDYERHRAA